MRRITAICLVTLASCGPAPQPVSVSNMSESQLIWYQGATDACAGLADARAARSGLLYGLSYTFERDRCIEGWMRHGYVGTTRFAPYDERHLPGDAPARPRSGSVASILERADYECRDAKDSGGCSIALASLRGGPRPPSNSPAERLVALCGPRPLDQVLQCMKGPAPPRR